MKKVHGTWLPDNDNHFEIHFERGPKHDGAATYQFAKLMEAMKFIPATRRRVAVDVGAHVGLWSRVLADMFGHVIAFEPIHQLNECFVKNVTAENVRLCTFALNDYSDILMMGNDSVDNSGNWRINPTGDTEAVAVCLDEFEMVDLDFLKIDVEGRELNVVKGAKRTIQRCKPFMIVEQKPGNAEKYGYGQTDAVDLLNSWGARVIWIKSGDYFMGW